jgi:hypothetical protein
MWAYYQAAHRHDPAWAIGVTNVYAGRFRGELPPPPRTLVQQNVVVNNIVVTNPATEFTSIKNQDYTLLATAKSANAGTPTYATPVDIMGVARPKGKAPDAGAYESQ